MIKEITSKIKQDKQGFAERRVFLFEQIIIISEEIERKKNSLTPPGYIFKNSIKANKMSITDHSDEGPLCFVLSDKTPGLDLKMICQAPDEEIKQNWVTQVKSMLQMQGDFLIALQSPIAYQKELTKELSAPEFSSLQRNAMLRKTHSQPQPAKTSTLPQPKSSSDKKSSQKQKKQEKHSRAKSVPSPVHSADASKDKDNSSKDAGSPTGDSDKKGAGGSPKPKRNFLEGFKNTLRPKKSVSGDSNSKSAKDKGGDSNSSGTAPSSEQYANQAVTSHDARDADSKVTSSTGGSTVSSTQIVS